MRTVAPGVRALLRDALGDQAEELSPAALRRIAGAMFVTARRELERVHRDPAQMDLVEALAATDRI